MLFFLCFYVYPQPLRTFIIYPEGFHKMFAVYTELFDRTFFVYRVLFEGTIYPVSNFFHRDSKIFSGLCLKRNLNSKRIYTYLVGEDILHQPRKYISFGQISIIECKSGFSPGQPHQKHMIARNSSAPVPGKYRFRY